MRRRKRKEKGEEKTSGWYNIQKYEIRLPAFLYKLQQLVVLPHSRNCYSDPPLSNGITMKPWFFWCLTLVFNLTGSRDILKASMGTSWGSFWSDYLKQEISVKWGWYHAMSAKSVFVVIFKWKWKRRFFFLLVCFLSHWYIHLPRCCCFLSLIANPTLFKLSSWTSDSPGILQALDLICT